jgi:hypothetical protein
VGVLVKLFYYGVARLYLDGASGALHTCWNFKRPRFLLMDSDSDSWRRLKVDKYILHGVSFLPVLERSPFWTLDHICGLTPNVDTSAMGLGQLINRQKQKRRRKSLKVIIPS